MKTIDRLKVKLRFSEDKVYEVGELLFQKNNLYFKYADEYLKTGLNLSPFKLPFKNEVYKGNQSIFEGLPGVFYDSLPDAWGRLLLDRMLASRGINYQTISPLDRLAFVGNRGYGALCYEPATPISVEYKNLLTLDQIAKESSAILSNNDSNFFETLKYLAGSSGGARPKIEVLYNPLTEEIIFGEKTSKEGFEHWIIKFPTHLDGADAAKVEYAYYLMAQKAGLTISESKLFEGENGAVYFGTKRFDRVGEKRLHMHSAAGLLHDDFQHSQLDYGHLLNLGFELTKNYKSYDQVFRLAAFNLYAHNRDDHSKNFAFLMDENGNWQFAPVYDLTFSSSAYGFHSTTYAGEGKNPTKKHLNELATTFEIKTTNQIIDQVKHTIALWPTIAEEVGISKTTQKLVWGEVSNLLNT